MEEDTVVAPTLKVMSWYDERPSLLKHCYGYCCQLYYRDLFRGRNRLPRTLEQEQTTPPPSKELRRRHERRKLFDAMI